MKTKLTLCLLAALAVPAVSWGGTVTFEATAGNIAGVTATRDAFRTAIGGGTVAGANGSFGGVRREINWDGVPDALAAPNNLPANFFNVNSPRGVVFSTPGTGFQVSANAGVAPVDFGNIDPTYPQDFAPFSPQRLFTALGSNITDVNFFLPGTTTAATVNSFGVIFSDVDLVGVSSISFFDENGALLFSRTVLATPGNESYSFLGVLFNAGERVGRVRITSGNAALAAGTLDEDSTDLVVMDDFIYGEPLVTTAPSVPEPGTLAMLGPGAAWLGYWIRKRRGTKR